MSEGSYLVIQHKVRSLTDDDLVVWTADGLHGDAAFAEQQYRNHRELKAIHALMREAVQALNAIRASLEVTNANRHRSRQ